MKAVIYNVETGEITANIEAPMDHLAMQCKNNESYILGAGADNTHYVDLENHTICEKLDFTVEALPTPCKVIIEGEEYSVIEQPTFSFDAPGRYEIVVDAGVKYLRKTFHVDQT